MPTLRSPNGQLVLELSLQSGTPTYQLTWRSKPLLAPSRLGLELASGPLTEGFTLGKTRTKSVRQSWKPVYGERSTVLDHYNELVVECFLDGKRPAIGRRTSAVRFAQDFTDEGRGGGANAPHSRTISVLDGANAPQITLTFRAYDTGIAFCYSLGAATVTAERTEFCFLADHAAWATYTAQGAYQKTPLSQLKPGCERPLVVEVSKECFVAVGEARLVDYARMKLAPLKETPFALGSELASPVSFQQPFTTPWRVLQVAESPGTLLEGNDLYLNLNAPCAIKDTRWIKPGKAIREVTLTTDGAKRCVDFAVKRKLAYIEFDAGWYGHEYDNASDATGVNLDPKRSKGPLDLLDVVRYARERGIGVWLYVNQRALTKQLDTILPLYASWGIVGVKYGFVNVGGQAPTSWLHEAVRKAAQHKLMVDIHDEYRPTGYSRTYPNLMTQEGIRGDEERQPNDLTLATVFTRMLAGAADNTFCYYDSRVDTQSSHAYQLAKSVCIFSPVQFLYWYDRPEKSHDEPELAFWDALPTTWDETRVLEGAIGEYAVIARRSGASWYIGGMTNATPRRFVLPLDFLPKGKPYTLQSFSDDPSAPTATKVRVEQHRVSSRLSWPMSLPERGGQALILTPEKA